MIVFFLNVKPDIDYMRQLTNCGKVLMTRISGMVTARDVAAAVGVAISTVGRAMADDIRISEETKLRVRDAAERLGYVGNTPAQIMRGISSKLIGLMIPDVANDFYASIAQALSEAVAVRGYQLVLSLTQDNADIEARQLRELVSARAAGVILVPTNRPNNDSRALLRTLPYVQFLRSRPELGKVWFGMDDEIAIFTAVSHLIAASHIRIAYIGGNERLSTGESRAKGYRAALSISGLADQIRYERRGSPTAQFGDDMTMQLLDIVPRPTAIVSGSVHITHGIIKAVERKGIVIPRDLSMVGFGSPLWFEWWQGGLSTIKPPVEKLTADCVAWFLRSLEEKSRDTSSTHTSVATSEFVNRNSISSPPKD